MGKASVKPKNARIIQGRLASRLKQVNSITAAIGMASTPFSLQSVAATVSEGNNSPRYTRDRHVRCDWANCRPITYASSASSVKNVLSMAMRCTTYSTVLTWIGRLAQTTASKGASHLSAARAWNRWGEAARAAPK